jgi:RTX calcium-binding nonapeptide repeat (4 copies)
LRLGTGSKRSEASLRAISGISRRACYLSVTKHWPKCCPVVTVLLRPASRVELPRHLHRGPQEDEKEKAMRWTIRVLVMVCVMVVLSAGAALAASPPIIGTNGDDRIKGTSRAEEISGLKGNDEITDGLGADTVYGKAGADNLIGYGGDTSVDRFRGGAGNDTIQSRDVPAAKDRLSCGSGVDRVYADKADVVSGECEKVSIR